MGAVAGNRVRSKERGVIELLGRVNGATVNGACAVLAGCRGFTVSRTGTGTYVVQLAQMLPPTPASAGDVAVLHTCEVTFKSASRYVYSASAYSVSAGTITLSTALAATPGTPADVSATDEMWIRIVGSASPTSAATATSGGGGGGGGGSYTPPQTASILRFAKPSDASTITQSGGTVSVVADQSSNAQNWVQATPANQPVYGTINGVGALVGDGARKMTSTALGAGLTTFSWVGVIQTAGNVAADNPILAFGAFSPEILVSAHQAGIYFGAYFKGNPTLADGAPHVLSVVRNGTTLNVYIDGTAVTGSPFTIGATATGTALSLMTDGSATNFNGSLGDDILYSIALTDVDRTALEASLKALYGTP